MSWDDALKGLLGNYPSLDAICVAGHDGTVYGSSDRNLLLPGSSKEITDILKLFSATSDTRFTLGGNPYFILNRDDSRVVGKHNKNSVLAVSTSKILVLGLCDESNGSKSGGGLDALFKIKDYYASVGY